MSVLRAPAASILLLAALHGGALAQTAGGTATGDPAGGLSNPLWSAPLEELTATRDRPLFSRTRRPPPVADAPQPTAEAPVAVAGPGAPPFSLIGTIVGDDAKVAILMENGSQKVLRLQLGAAAAGWSVAAVEPRTITLTRGPQSVTLELPKSKLLSQ